MELKELISNAEKRYIWYKTELENTFKDKVSFPKDDELSEWYKSLLREGKNISESTLKTLVNEKKNENDGLNPPFCYPY